MESGLLLLIVERHSSVIIKSALLLLIAHQQRIKIKLTKTNLSRHYYTPVKLG